MSQVVDDKLLQPTAGSRIAVVTAGVLSSNPQHTFASNVTVSARTGKLVFAFSAMLLVVPLVCANPMLSRGSKPSPMTVTAQAGVNARTGKAQTTYFTSEQQVRAVRASLKAALTPDPVAMGALLFCAFALRWMRLRKEEQQSEQPARTITALPGAA